MLRMALKIHKLSIIWKVLSHIITICHKKSEIVPERLFHIHLPNLIKPPNVCQEFSQNLVMDIARQV